MNNISLKVYTDLINFLTNIVIESGKKIESTYKNIKELKEDDVEKFESYMKVMHNIHCDIYTTNLILDRIDSIEELKTKN